jgi:L-ascorbate metabolism protein UlaG (beta-lactamase superfamily)
VKLAIPMHFGTFPVLTQDTTLFRQALKKQGVPFRQLHPGETIAFEGKRIKPAGK